LAGIISHDCAQLVRLKTAKCARERVNPLEAASVHIAPVYYLRDRERE